jgi:hypothetical protein
VPRLSLYKPNHTNDYKYIDRLAKEMFDVGGTDIHLHKYLGPIGQSTGTATEPVYASDSVANIQDLLFLENRDRKYDTSIYTMRGVYRVGDNDFDLSQFGLFLSGDTIWMTFHLNEIVDTIGRKIIAGDVLELPHLKDYYPLDDALEASLKRYYVVQEASFAAEGFSVTWYPHLWRVKLNPLVDSQEYKDITDTIKAGENTNDTIGDVLSTIDKYTAINDAIVTEAEANVPASGYDTTFIYHAPVDESTGLPGDPDGTSPDKKVTGYLTSDGLPPNGNSVAAGIEFPGSPTTGDFYLRVDYSPNRLFRWDGLRWVKIEDNVRTDLTPGLTNTTQRSSFTNNINSRMTDRVAWDAIKIARPYTPPAGSTTISFDADTKVIIANVTYNAAYGVKTFLNGIRITNTMANASGNTSITLTNTLANVSVLEYGIFSDVTPEKQGLSSALRPDN